MGTTVEMTDAEQRSQQEPNPEAQRRRPEFSRSPISRPAKIIAGVAVVLLAIHMVLTAVFNAPSQEIRSSALWGLSNRYVQPYLVQDYKIFAPEPIDSDHQLWVRAWIETPGGDRVRSEWVNSTEVELSAFHRKVLRKQLSIMGAERLMAAYSRLGDAHRDAAAVNHLDGEALYPLRDAMLAADDSNVAAVDAFIRANNFAASYASQVSQALWGDQGEVLAVQTRAVYDPVVRWNDRKDPDAERPAASYTDLGWVPVLEWHGQDRDAFGKTFRSWADNAGVAPELEDAASGGSPANNAEAQNQNEEGGR
ncbi:DUF5819 family protein [Leucobacter sp. GX24907]